MRIAIGKSRKSVNWTNKDIEWDALCEQLSKTKRTNETIREYNAMPKDEQDKIKDVGGFVGGALKGERRLRGNVVSRSLITLDADYALPNTWDTISSLLPYEMVAYSTHKHTEVHPRLRIVLPMTREVTPEEYEPISRLIADEMGIDVFDVTTHDVGRLFYWPSTPADAPFLYERVRGSWVDPDEVLGRYADWRDAKTWPLGSREGEVWRGDAKKQGDPTTKPGAVGLFCRTYDVPEAIECFLSDVYDECDEQSGYTRYTYVGGSTSGGAVLYDGDGGSFLYSHHATDPAGGVLCNAFDLVRLHLFGDKDSGEDVRGRDVTKLESYKAMCDLVNADKRCKLQMLDEMRGEMQEDYGSWDYSGGDCDELIGCDGEVDTSWVEELTIDPKTKGFECSIPNIVLVLENDPAVRGVVAYNELTGRKVLRRDAPWRRLEPEERGSGSMWRDSDDSNLRSFFEKYYKMVSRDKIRDASNIVMVKNAYHPVRGYLEKLTWDGVERADRVLIEYLGAEDSPYVRAVTRTWLLAAVARVYQPGIKFDNVLMLIGPQGLGKSTVAARLGGPWFTDSFSTVQGKEAFEQLRGYWIVEMAELAATKKADAENVKHFITKTDDTYRPAYAENIVSFPRQCVFFGTSNEDNILRDATGNRRFWTVAVKGIVPGDDLASHTASGEQVFALLTQDKVDRIWAEVVSWWKMGVRSLHLPADMTEQLLENQEQFIERDPIMGAIEEYLNKPLPAAWDTRTKEQRRAYYAGTDFGSQAVAEKDGVQRDIVCVAEMAYEMGLAIDMRLSVQESRRYTNILKSMPGWTVAGNQRRGDYGTQKSFKRSSLLTESD